MGFILCRIQSGVMDKHSFNRRVLYLLFLDSLILFDSLGGDGRGGLALRGVVLLNVSCGSGDSPPCLATTDADGYGGECDCAKQNNCQ